VIAITLKTYNKTMDYLLEEFHHKTGTIWFTLITWG